MTAEGASFQDPSQAIPEPQSSLSKNFYIFIMIGILLIIRTLIHRTRKATEEKQRKIESFRVPKEGGVLQKLQKDEDGNISLKLAKKIKITSDTFIFRFSFPDPDFTFGLPIGQHVIFSAVMPTKEKPEGELVQRKYTPTSTIFNNGYVDFVIKIYRKNVHPRFPEGGLMTQYLETLEPGAIMLMEGPKGRLAYEGFGNFLITRKTIRKTRIGMVAGGTGITPCYQFRLYYQVAQAALQGDDGTNLSLLFGCRTVDDLLMKDELDQLQENNKDRFKLTYTVDVKPEGKPWEGNIHIYQTIKIYYRFVTKEMISQNLPAPSADTIILFCGPPPFEEMMKKHLKELGYADDMVFKF